MGKLEEYRRKRDFGTTPEPAGDTTPSGGRRSAVLRHPEARGLAPALRLPHRTRRRPALVGGTEGPVARHRRQAARDARRGPPDRVRLVRRRDPGRRIRRRHGDALGPRFVGARPRRPARAPRAGPPQVLPLRRAAARALDAREDQGLRRQERRQLAAVQGARRGGPWQSGVRRHCRVDDERRDRPHDGRDRRRRRSGVALRCECRGQRRLDRRPRGCSRRDRGQAAPRRRIATRVTELAGAVAAPMPRAIDVELASLVESVPEGDAMAARDQARRLPDGRLPRPRSRAAREPFGARLDRAVRPDRCGRGRTRRGAGHPRRRGRRAARRRDERLPGTAEPRAAGRGGPSPLRGVRSALPRRQRPARGGASRTASGCSPRSSPATPTYCATWTTS